MYALGDISQLNEQAVTTIPTEYSQNQYSSSHNNYQSSVSKPVIQQVFQESSESINNYYYTATMSMQEPEPEPKLELPANLMELLSQLKKKGFVSSDVPADPITSDDPLVVDAQKTSQQINRYASEETSQDNPICGYVATFATPEMMTQKRRQYSQNSKRWTQSGWMTFKTCVYFLKPGGCNRGDKCRYIHDEELRRQRMAELSDRRRRTEFRGGFRNDNDSRLVVNDMLNLGGYGCQIQPGFDEHNDYNQQNHYQQFQYNATSPNDHWYNFPNGPRPSKRQCVRRFDQCQELDYRAQRRFQYYNM